MWRWAMAVPDALLYVALGDGGGAGDPFATGQDPGSLLGSILRIDPAGDPYSIPGDNPFVDRGVRMGCPKPMADLLRPPDR